MLLLALFACSEEAVIESPCDGCDAAAPTPCYPVAETAVAVGDAASPGMSLTPGALLDVVGVWSGARNNATQEGYGDTVTVELVVDAGSILFVELASEGGEARTARASTPPSRRSRSPSKTTSPAATPPRS